MNTYDPIRYQNPREFVDFWLSQIQPESAPERRSVKTWLKRVFHDWKSLDPARYNAVNIFDEKYMRMGWYRLSPNSQIRLVTALRRYRQRLESEQNQQTEQENRDKRLIELESRVTELERQIESIKHLDSPPNFEPEHLERVVREDPEFPHQQSGYRKC